MSKYSSPEQNPDTPGFFSRWLTAVAWVYFTVLFGWLLLYIFTGDRFGYLGLINALGVWFFAPLPLIIVIATFVRRRSVWAGSALGTLAFLWLFGGLFIPSPNRARAASPTLKVMTYNVLGLHDQVAPVIGVIREENPDVVFLQEVNPSLAHAIEEQLDDVYPYTFLDPQIGVSGMGLISKYPLSQAGEKLPLKWVGVPQVLTLDWQGTRLTLVHFHTWPTGLGPPWAVAENFRQREQQASALAEFAASHPGPLIIAGDANTAPLSKAYKIITHELLDVWAAKGFGFGHTFPGSDLPGSSRPRLAGIPVPSWLARIDYVFVSKDWTVLQARLGEFDRVSDHRPVIATISLSE